MTLLEATAWSSSRAAVVGVVVALMVRPIRYVLVGLAARQEVRQRVAFAAIVLCVLMPAATPGLLIGYAYRPEGLRWVITPWKADALHAVISAARVLPWGLLVATLVDGVGRRSEVTWEQSRALRPLWRHRIGQLRFWSDRHRGALLAGIVGGLCTFSEAEVAALLQARGWTEWTFRKLAGGWPGGELVPQLWPVIAISVGALGAVLGLSRLRHERGGALTAEPGRPSRFVFSLAVSAAFFGMLVSCVVPISRLVSAAISGADSLMRQPTFLSEIASTVAATGCATIGAIAVAGSVVVCRSTVVCFGRFFAVAVVVVGTLGPMLASVLMQSLAALPTASTVLHQYVALAAVLSPFAVALSLDMARRERSRAAVASRLLLEHGDPYVRTVARRGRWRTVIGPRVAAVAVVFWVGFWDLQTAALLAPPGYATAPGRLYNLAHYGQSETLAAMLLVLSVVAFAGPAAILVSTYPWRVR